MVWSVTHQGQPFSKAESVQVSYWLFTLSLTLGPPRSATLHRRTGERPIEDGPSPSPPSPGIPDRERSRLGRNSSTNSKEGWLGTKGGPWTRVYNPYSRPEAFESIIQPISYNILFVFVWALRLLGSWIGIPSRFFASSNGWGRIHERERGRKGNR